jgi:uncharacterized protein (DUF362 family)
MMPKISRREFLLTLAAGAGGLALDQFLAACGRKEAFLEPTPGDGIPTATQAELAPGLSRPAAQSQSPTETPADADSTDDAAGMEPSPSATSGSSSVSDLVVVHGSDVANEQVDEIVRRALAGLGGIQNFVPKGANVIIKPNICVAYHSYEYAATTNPWVVGALVKLCLEASAKSVRVMDAPFGGTAERAYAVSGIEEQVKVAGGEMVLMPGFKYVPTDIPEGVDLNTCDIFDDILRADVLINVPIAKHHSLARLTLGMKNLMGVIRDRPAMHRNLGQRLADLTSRVRPTLTVVDAVRILMANGPTGGNLDDVKQLNTVIASADIVAADSYAATLFGMKPEDLDYVRAGTAMGLGRSDIHNLKIEEISVSA